MIRTKHLVLAGRDCCVHRDDRNVNTIDERRSIYRSPTGDNWQSKTLFLAILYPRSSIVKSVFDCRLSGVNMLRLSRLLSVISRRFCCCCWSIVCCCSHCVWGRGGGCLTLVYAVDLSSISSFAIISHGRRSWLFLDKFCSFILVLLSCLPCGCLCPTSLHSGAMGWSGVGLTVILWYSLVIPTCLFLFYCLFVFVLLCFYCCFVVVMLFVLVF